MNTGKEIEQCHHHGLLTEKASGSHPPVGGAWLGESRRLGLGAEGQPAWGEGRSSSRVCWNQQPLVGGDAGSSATGCEAGSVPNQRHVWHPPLAPGESWKDTAGLLSGGSPLKCQPRTHNRKQTEDYLHSTLCFSVTQGAAPQEERVGSWLQSPPSSWAPCQQAVGSVCSRLTQPGSLLPRLENNVFFSSWAGT